MLFQTCVLFRSDVCLVSIRRVSCFNQTCILFRSDVCPVSIRCVSCFRRVSLISVSSRLLVSASRLARLDISLVSAHRVVSACSSRHSRSYRLIGSSRLARLGSSARIGLLVSASRSSRLIAARLVSAGSSRHGSSRRGSPHRLVLAHRFGSSRSFHRWRCVALTCCRLSLSSATIISFHRVELPVKLIAGTYYLEAISNQR